MGRQYHGNMLQITCIEQFLVAVRFDNLPDRMEVL